MLPDKKKWCFMLYVRDTKSYVRHTKSYVRHTKSFVRDTKSYVRVLSRTYGILSRMYEIRHTKSYVRDTKYEFLFVPVNFYFPFKLKEVKGHMYEQRAAERVRQSPTQNCCMVRVTNDSSA